MDVCTINMIIYNFYVFLFRTHRDRICKFSVRAGVLPLLSPYCAMCRERHQRRK